MHGSRAQRSEARVERGQRQRHHGSSIGVSAAISCERAGRQRREDAVLDPPQRIADVALRELPALLVFGRTGGHGQRPVDRLDDVGDRDRRRRLATACSRRACPGATSAGRGARAAAAPSPSARSGMSYCSAISRALADAASGLHGEVLHRHQRVVGFFGESQHMIRHHIPSCSFAASDIRSFVHARLPDDVDLASVTPGTACDRSADLPGSDCAAGQPGAVSVIRIAGDAVGVDERCRRSGRAPRC